MNNFWSSNVQGINTLYYSRKLRFDDMFKEQYKSVFRLDENKKLKILEIGCGPGALASAFHRWYPGAEITGIDRDTLFITFAKKHENNVDFLEGDATALPFANDTFDATVSNTVCEHIEPEAFFREQYRVLKPGGVCLVLSTRKSINVTPECLGESETEKRFWEKAQKCTVPFEYPVCRYPMSEAELPTAMEKYGFGAVSAAYTAIALTPDDPAFSPQKAHEIIDSQRYSSLDSVNRVLRGSPDFFAKAEAQEMHRLINAKFDRRISQYDRGEKQWDTAVTLTMTVRGVK